MDLMTLYVLIRRFEGLRLKAYLCPAGIWTCGYGSTGPDVKPGVEWTLEYAETRMKADASRFALGTLRLCPTLGGDNLSAIADFAYNLGLTRLASSTLLRKLKKGNTEGARVELHKWVYGGGKKLPGLVIRRAIEASLLK